MPGSSWIAQFGNLYPPDKSEKSQRIAMDRRNTVHCPLMHCLALDVVMRHDGSAANPVDRGGVGVFHISLIWRLCFYVNRA